MSSVSGIRLPGLATGMDTEAMIKEMLTGEQNKIDKVKQKEQTIKWQQDIYREVIKEIQGLNDKYFSISSENSITKSSAWNTLTVSSSNSSIITATGSAGANPINYKFEVIKLAESAKATADGIREKGGKGATLESLGLKDKETTFTIKYGDDGTQVSKAITISNEDTIESLVNKINDATGGNVKAAYSEMTGAFTIESKNTGSSNGFEIIGDSLDFLGLKGNKGDGKFIGADSDIKVYDNNGTEIINAPIDKTSNSFTIDGITYNLHSAKAGEIVEINSTQNVQPIIDNMKSFVEDYNKLMEKIYDLVTQKTNKDYQPLTEDQKKDMSEEEIERWEKKAKEGMLRNDSEMRKFIDDMNKSIFGENMQVLNEMGLTSHEDYNKKGQISLNEDKFRKSLETDADKVYKIFAKDNSSVLETMKKTVKDYVGSSSSVFAKKAGIEKTASVANNFYSEQLKRQAESIKNLQRKMDDKENDLYKKFSALEASMNKLNSQMNYFTQM